MSITCKKCNHQQRFDVEPSDYVGYVCPNCSSYFKIDASGNWTFSTQVSQTSSPQWAVLNDAIRVKDTTYYIITKIQRWNIDEGISNEYVGLSKDDQEIYWSDGSDYACELYAIDSNEITEDQGRIKYSGGNFDLEYHASQTVRFAEGFVFEDLSKESLAQTYVNTVNEDRFVSKETFGSKIEYYAGNYIDEARYLKLFPAYKEFGNKSGDIVKKLSTILIVFILIFAALYYFLMAPYFGTSHYKYDEKFTSKTAMNDFIGKSFKLEAKVAKKLVLESISETNLKDLNLTIQLVNEVTNEVQSTGPMSHFENDINKASGLTVDFCNVNPGRYHLVFVTNAYKSDSSTLELHEDYKLTYGGVSHWLVVLGLGLIVVLYFVVRSSLLNAKNKNFILSEDVSYVKILKFNYFGLLYVGILLFFFGLIYYNNNFKNCSTTQKINTLEDNTYTGSRAHYFRRSLSSYSGNHK